VAIRSDARAFVAGFVHRVEEGLLRGAPRSRCNYVVVHRAANGLRFQAAGWKTAFNVGLNDVELTASPAGSVRYVIRYNQWAGYAVALGAAIGLVLVVFLVAFDVRSYIMRHAESRFGALSISQNIAIAWAMAIFWGFVWPWILIALHKRPLRRLMERIVAEVDAATKK
jgi:hypothetical protein